MYLYVQSFYWAIFNINIIFICWILQFVVMSSWKAFSVLFLSSVNMSIDAETYLRYEFKHLNGWTVGLRIHANTREQRASFASVFLHSSALMMWVKTDVKQTECQSGDKSLSQNQESECGAAVLLGLYYSALFVDWSDGYNTLTPRIGTFGAKSLINLVWVGGWPRARPAASCRAAAAGQPCSARSVAPRRARSSSSCNGLQNN